uniref:Uncharacterized protein n=1 Tax=Anguilla anguilla TaxID=7936 RepID=A0A0E9RGV0_ANGAN
MSRGKGTSGFSPVSTMGMLALFISFSTNLSLRSISSQRRTSFTNFRWNTFTSGFRSRNWTIPNSPNSLTQQ